MQTITRKQSDLNHHKCNCILTFNYNWQTKKRWIDDRFIVHAYTGNPNEVQKIEFEISS